MRAEEFLSRLDGVKGLHSGQWMARCPSHDDRSASLSVREEVDGRLLIKCFAECPTPEVLDSMGLTFADLFPERCLGHHKPIKRRWSPRVVCEVMGASASNVALLWERMQSQELTSEELTIFKGELQNIILLSNEALNG